MPSAFLAALCGLCALALGIGIGRFAYTPVLPFMQSDLGLSIEAAGYIASSNFAGYLLGALLAIGVPPARRRTAYVAAILISVASTLAMAMLTAPIAIAATRLASGVASAFVLVHGSAIVLDHLARERRAGLSGLLYAGVGTGIAASALVVALAAAAGAGSTQLWLALGVASGLLAPMALMLKDTAPAPGTMVQAGATGPTPQGHAPASGSIARKSALRWLVLAYGCLGFGYVITATFVVVIVRSQPEWRAWEMLVWLVVGLTAAPSNWIWLKVSRRQGPWKAMIIAFLMEAVGVAAAVSADSLLMVLLGAGLLGGTFMGITALGLTTARELSAGSSGPIIARMTLAFSLGQIIGPAVGGWIAARAGGFSVPSQIAAATLVAAAGMVAIAGRHAKKAG